MASMLFCCAFTYDSERDWGATRTALGIACPWSELCIEFNRQGSSCPVRNVIHYKTISIVGPKLFAVSIDAFKVFYHDGEQWHQYQSARNIQFGRLEDFMEFFYDDDHNNNEDWSQEENNGKDRDDDNKSNRQAKDLPLNNDSNYWINQAILYNCLIRLVLFVRLHFYLIQYQSLIH